MFSLDYKKTKELVDAGRPKDYDDLYRMVVAGDQYLDGRGFIGPKGQAPSGEGMSEAQARAAGDVQAAIGRTIKSAFTPEDVLSEVVARRVDIILAKEPQWSVEREEAEMEAQQREGDTAEDQGRAVEVETHEVVSAALAKWWDEKGIHDVLRDHLDNVSTFQRGVLHFFLPPGLFDDGGNLTADTAEEALDAIYLDALRPDTAHEITDPATRRRAILSIWTELEPGQPEAQARHFAQIAYIDGDKQTVLRIVERAGTETDASLDLGAHPLAMETKERKAFISPPMRQAQKALNTASTEMRIVNDDEGFPKRMALNAQQPGDYVEKTDDKGNTYLEFVPLPLSMSPGSLTFVQGEAVPDPEARDQEGQPITKDVKNASVTTLEAGNVTSYTAEMDRRTSYILRRARQLYVQMSGDATASGESRKTALFDQDNDGLGIKSRLDRAGKWALETAWNLACYLAGQPERAMHVDGLRVVFDCRLSRPRPSEGEIRAFIELKKERVWSNQTAQSQTGIDDTDAEKERIQKEAEEMLTPMERQNLDRQRLLTEADQRSIERPVISENGSEGSRNAIEDAAGDE